MEVGLLRNHFNRKRTPAIVFSILQVGVRAEA
jgi:hypothetical protein